MQESSEKTLIQQLREATGPLHQKLDYAFFQDINNLSKTEYLNFLIRHHSFYNALLENLDSKAQTFKNYLKELISLIEKDLQNANQPIPRIKLGTSSISLHQEGVAYVVYGSSNGAAMINAKIEKQDWAKHLSRSFLSRTEENWRPFFKEINQHSKESDPIIESACKAFEMMHEISRQ